MPLCSEKIIATGLGWIAVLLWGTTIACSRSLAEQLGTFTSAAVVYLAAGVLGCGVLAARGQLTRIIRGTSRRYLFVCGGLMALYTLLLYAAVGGSPSRGQLVAVTMANYLWPCLTLVFSVPVLGWTARPLVLVAGSLLGLAGVALALGADSSLFVRNTASLAQGAPVVAALAAAVAWALYSNLSRRWAGGDSAGAMPLFSLATGCLLWLLRWAVREQTTWTPRSALEGTYVVLGPTLLAYTFWDVAARRGNLPLIAALSYLTPVLSVAISSLHLGISLQPTQWVASLIVVAGALVSSQGVREAVPG